MENGLILITNGEGRALCPSRIVISCNFFSVSGLQRIRLALLLLRVCRNYSQSSSSRAAGAAEPLDRHQLP